MIRIGLLILTVLIFTNCGNNSPKKNENTNSKKQEISSSSILGKWKITDGNPILEGTFISEYFENGAFQQNGVITSFQPSYTCQASSHGTYSISDDILSYAYLAEKMFDCQPEEYQLMVNSYMGNKELEISQNKIILLNETTMVQENLTTKKRFNFTRIVE